jgi:ABC-type transport system involved in cytochrome c biogenesis permease subunit
MGLGLVAVGYYLTATYRRSARFGELAKPLVPGMALFVPGALGICLTDSHAGPTWLASDAASYAMWAIVGLGGVLTIVSAFAMIGEAANRGPMHTLGAGLAGIGVGLVGLVFRSPSTSPGPVVPLEASVAVAGLGTVVSVLGLFGRTGRVLVPAATPPADLDVRSLAIQATAARVKPIAGFLYRAMQVGVLLVATGTILGGVWADSSWGRFWGWDPKEVWALITLLVYLVPLHGRFAGWVTPFGLVVSAVVCFGSVLMAWYGVNFVLGVGLHSYGFSEGGGQGVVLSATLAVLAAVLAAAWRRGVSQSLSGA